MAEDKQVKQIDEDLDSKQRSVKELADQIKMLQAERKARLDEIEEERTKGWREKRLYLPEVTNRELVEHRLNELCDGMGWHKPAYVIFTCSPTHFHRFLSEYRGNFLTKRLTELNPFQEPIKAGQDRLSPLYKPQVLHRVPRQYELDQAELLMNLAGEILDFIPQKDKFIVLEKPREVHFGRGNRVSRRDGPAVIWRDGDRSWFFDGVTVSQSFIEGKVTLTKINREHNAEKKRILIERFGEAEYLKARKARCIKEDKKGKLWRIQGRWVSPHYNRNQRWVNGYTSEDEVYVEVLNSTPEPDGSTRSFFLRVPPDMKTPTAAIAWTFGKKEKEYSPKKET